MRLLNAVSCAPIAAVAGYFSTLYTISAVFDDDAEAKVKFFTIIFFSGGYYGILLIIGGILGNNSSDTD